MTHVCNVYTDQARSLGGSWGLNPPKFKLLTKKNKDGNLIFYPLGWTQKNPGSESETDIKTNQLTLLSNQI